MRPALVVVPLLVATLSAGCISTKFGREFASPDPRAITVGQTDKRELQRLFGEPYQVGIDSGDATWRWFFGQRNRGAEQTKDLSVRFNGDGTVKSYAFTSNFPADMTRLK
jgi:outer membrane protein assembly factor BamE (lipoprotein component of BamABCDE complex)